MRNTSCLTLIDKARQAEIDNFYEVCQMHRAQYKDQTGRLHSLDYFDYSRNLYSCPPDPTSTYLKFPIRYIRYKQPYVRQISNERTLILPTLESAFISKHSRYNCNAFKR